MLTTEEGDTEKANPLLMGNTRTYVRHLSSSGREYFADPITGATLWKEDLPGGAHIVDQTSASKSAVSGSNRHRRARSFQKHQSIDGKVYYSDTQTKETVWELPEDAILI